MEVTGAHEAFEIEESSAVGEIRRRAAMIAIDAGLDAARAGDAALIAAEAASNVVKHGRHGGALLAPLPDGISLTVWDRGPGMDVARCLRDGMSTAGTAGAGLGAISRLASRWDIFSAAGHGTVLTATVRPRGAPEPPPGVAIGGVSVPYPGETACGDGWDAVRAGDVAVVLVCDGLGHGPAAAKATEAVREAFHHRPDDAPAAILERGDRAARSTRGAAAAVARIDLAARVVTFAAVGNIAAWIWTDPQVRAMVSQHGTLGQAMPTVREERFPLAPGAALILCSDGLKSRLDLSAYPALAARAPATIAAVLWRDHTRGRDDATAVVVRP